MRRDIVILVGPARDHGHDLAVGAAFGGRDRIGHVAEENFQTSLKIAELFIDRFNPQSPLADAEFATRAEAIRQQPALLSLMAPCRVGSDEFAAWKALHEERGWPWLPDPGRQDWVYFPAGGPAGLDAFEAAVRGTRGEDDAGGREAAE